MTREIAAGTGARPREIVPDQAVVSVAVSELAPVSGGPDAPESTLADAASRELRATLALVSGYSQSLLYLTLDEATRRQYLERISQATDNLTRQVNQILDMSELGSNRPALRRQPVSLSWLLDHVAEDLSATAEARAVTYWVPPLLPLIDVDPAWIGHVLRNLVSNATQSGAGTVTIRARARDDVVIVSVQDDGPPLDEDERERVFDPANRALRVAPRDARRHGFSLSLCRQLVEAHGGAMWLDDVPDGVSISFSPPTLDVLDPSEEPAPMAVALTRDAAGTRGPAAGATGTWRADLGPLVPAPGGIR